ncbi:dihydrodipicolinate synthase family protein [Acuticoccus sp. I52.16.1]|uniref:dihydrodipicolinate synthase family protein n=1 Tax=Acuticoccus sp. I52.16.1 TaxID=2928472 RepID=UPI001FCFE1CA|nr:dihydrodipicolinate synthase family protein [Acuticoccus sp. I52.16.1]UOM34152.1 dihydrodipicolinate synthase family protein [Acuticoccus sp. I52.16.1]
MAEPSLWRGVLPALPCPLDADGTVDHACLAAHVDRLAALDGVTGFLVNGHAGENVTMPLAWQRDVARTAIDAAAGRVPIVVGVNVPAAAEAARHAAALEELGAAAIMIFAPDGWGLFNDPAAVEAHHHAILAATKGDVMLFQGSVNTGRISHHPAVLARLAQLPRVVAVKEGSWEVAAYEASRRAVKAVAPQVAVMGSGDEHLFTSAVIGSEGAIVSLAAVTPQPIIDLLAAVEAGDLAAARAANDRIYPIARAIYGAAPGGRANARLKTCLAMRGVFPRDTMIAPTAPTPPQEHAMLREALVLAGETLRA